MRHAAYAAGQAGAVESEARLDVSAGGSVSSYTNRELVFDDQQRQNDICWLVVEWGERLRRASVAGPWRRADGVCGRYVQ
jgi:hypothetical protein